MEHGSNTDFQSQDIILPAAAIESFNPEPGTAANSGGPTALVDPTGRLAVGSGLTICDSLCRGRYIRVSSVFNPWLLF